MRSILFSFSLVLSVVSSAHPAIGIVKNSKGFIFYSDLSNVYRLDPSTHQTTIAVRNVHSHELFIDEKDNLYGEHFWFADEATNRFDHYLWRLNANGKLDTISGTSNAYAGFDFSVVRDLDGNQYRVQALTTDHILKRKKDGTVETLATGAFKGISWLQPLHDGALYFANGNAIYKINAKDVVVKVAGPVSSDEKDPGIYRIFQKNDVGPLYVAVAGDRAIKRINSNGSLDVIFKEKDPDQILTGGVFDNDGKLWVLEWNPKNEVRVINVDGEIRTASAQNIVSDYRYWLVGVVFIGIAIFLIRVRMIRRRRQD